VAAPDVLLAALPALRAQGVDNMRIAFIISIFPRLSELFILNQITELLRRGHDVDIFPAAPFRAGILHEDVERYSVLSRTYYPLGLQGQAPPGISLPPSPSLVECWRNRKVLLAALNIVHYGKPALELKLFRQTIPLLGKRPYDIIHCHFGTNGLRALNLMDMGVLTGSKLMTTFHGPKVLNPTLQGSTHVYHRLFARGNLFTVGTHFMAHRLQSLGCPTEKIVILPVSVNLKNFEFAGRSAPASGPIRILTVARLSTMKGLEYSIRAVAALIRENANIEYRIAGEGPLRRKLERLIEQLGISDRVHLLGGKTQDEICRLYRESHIFVLPSIVTDSGGTETQALVLQEAQAAGLPVIATTVGGVPEGVMNQKSGWLVPPRDPNALADRLRFLMGHPEVWDEMGRAGRIFVAAKYDAQKVNDQLVAIYRELLSPEQNTL
jgi:colanic acid/amylovoran biosynthesis glycosyltransferase